METKVFHSFMSSMLNNLSAIQCNFEENQLFLDNSALARSLESLAGQVENLRISLVAGYDKK
nr:MAG TPA: hypothetical protein [Microviridae sp.]